MTENNSGNISETRLMNELLIKDELLVLFYATWCSFSRRFLPIFEDYAKTKPDECQSVIIDDKPEICKEYSITYYPTVVMFKKGRIYKRLDSIPGIGLDKEQFKKFTEDR